MTRVRWWIWFVVLVSCHWRPEGVQAQGNPDSWGPPVVLMAQERVTDQRMAVDSAGGVHAFWMYQEIGRDGSTASEVIYYAAWDGKSWSEPGDVLASSDLRSAGLIKAVASSDGILHVLWRDSTSCLRHSWAPVALARSARAWLGNSICVATQAFDGDLVIDSAAAFHYVYSSILDGQIYYARRENLERRPSSPVRISASTREGAFNKWGRLAIDQRQRLHVVWTELSGGWPPTGIFYAQSTDGGEHWSEPLEIAGEGYDQINVVVDTQNRIHLFWNGQAGVGGRYHQWSADGGQTWTERMAIVPPGKSGTAGFPEVAIDSAGVLHLVTPADYPGDRGGPVVHMSWDGHNWSPPEGASPGTQEYAEQPQVAITGGNQLHVIYFDARKRILYATRRIMAPPIPLIPLPTMTPTSMPSPTAIPATTPTPAKHAPSLPISSLPDEPGSSRPGPADPIVAGIVPVLLLVVAVVLINTYRSDRR